MAKHDVLKVYSDADGCCINWLDGFIKYMNSIGHSAKSDQPEHFSMIDIFDSVERPWEHIQEYQKSPFYRNLNAYDDARAAFDLISDLGGEIIIITSCGLDPITTSYREQHVEREFGNSVNELIMLDYAAPKLSTLKQLPSGMFIEDQGKVAAEGVEAGHRSLLRDRSYNRQENFDGVFRVNCMIEVAHAIENSVKLRALEREEDFAYSR